MKSYDDSSIKVLSDIEHIRKVPLMYISANTPSLQMFEEIFNNSLDEALNGFAKIISIHVDYVSNTIEIIDDGRGLPQGVNETLKIPTIEAIYCKLNAGGKYDQDSYAVSGGLHGVGSCVVNALSSKMEVETWRSGNGVRYLFERGIKVKSSKKSGYAQGHGTRVTYTLDDTVDLFRDDPLDHHEHDIVTRLNLIATLYKNISFMYNGSEVKGGNLRELLPDVKYFLKDPIEIDLKDFKLILNWTDSVRYGSYDSYCNLIHTTLGGDHIAGFEESVKRVFGSDESILGINVILSVAYPQVKFEGQAKGRAKSKELKQYVSDKVYTELRRYMREHTNEFNDLTYLFKSKRDILDMRAHKRRVSKVDRRSNFLTNLDTGGFVDATTTDRSLAELFTCEGLSAGGSLKQARDVETQAVMPLRGKIINAYNSSVSQVLQNKEIATIINAMGCGVKSDFNLKNCRYNKIVHYGDPDPDGLSIACEFISFFAVYMPDIIRNGMLYVAVTPLYSTEYKGEFIPIYDEKTRDRYLSKGCKISRNKGLGEFNASDFVAFMRPETRHLIQVDPGSDLSLIEHYMGGDSSNRLNLLKELGIYREFN